MFGRRLASFEFRFSNFVSRSIDNRQSSIVNSRAGKRIDGLQALKPAEVAVSSDDLRHSVLEAESSNVSVVNQIAGGACLAKDLLQDRSVASGLGEQKERRGCQYLF